MVAIEGIRTKDYCNVLAILKEMDPVGYASNFDDAVIIETPLSWKYELWQDTQRLPSQVIQLLDLWLETYHITGHYGHRPLVIAPDPEYSVEGFRRVMFYQKPEGAFSQYIKTEYLAPEAVYGDLVYALYENRDQLPEFEQYRVPEADNIRDLLVCTHGTVDAACGKFGFRVFQKMRAQPYAQTVRVWRVNHFGGHVFAPTILDMPSGHYWAFVEPEQGDQIAQKNQPVSQLKAYYRGWSGVDDGFLQAAERAVWQTLGWDWFDYLKSGEILRQDTSEKPQWAEVAIHYQTPDGQVRGVYSAHVEVSGYIDNPSGSFNSKTYAYAQYHVSSLKHSLP